MQAGYFMSTEQEQAAKWQMFENYKKLRSEQAVIYQNIQDWAKTLRHISDILWPNFPGNLTFMDSYPSKDEITRAIQQAQSLNDQLSTLRNNLKQAGMDNLG